MVSKELLVSAIEHVSNGVVISDPNQEDNPVIYVNKGFEEITGCSKDDIIGKNCRFLQGEDTDSNELQKLKNAIKKRQEVRVILKNYTKQGKAFYNELYITPLFVKGKLKYFIGVQNDITAQHGAQEELDRYRSYLEEQVSKRTQELNDVNEDLRKEIEQRKQSQEKIINLNNKLKHYTRQLQRRIEKTQGPQLNKNERYILYLLNTYPHYNVSKLAITFNLPVSTVHSIKERLNNTHIKEVIQPHAQFFPFLTLVTYTEAQKEIQEKLKDHSAVIHAVCGKQTGYYVLATKDWAEYRRVQDELSVQAKTISEHHSARCETFFSFGTYLKSTLSVYASEEKPQGKDINLNETDKRVLYGLCKYPQATLKELSKRLQISIVTISKRKQKFRHRIQPLRYPVFDKLARYIIIGKAQPDSYLDLDGTGVTLARDELDLSDDAIIIPTDEIEYFKLEFASAIKRLYLVEK